MQLYLRSFKSKMSLQTVKFISPILQAQRFLSLNVRYTQTSTNTTSTYMSDVSTVPTKEETKQHTASVQKEIDHHASLSSTWWDLNGPMHGLHKMNETRVPFVRDGLVAHDNMIDKSLINTSMILQDKVVLEVGCGGGILTEALARLGANLTGIDLGADVITTARKHLEQHCPELSDRITYKIEPIEVHAKLNRNHYDAVICSEVLEHIDDKEEFLTHCIEALKPGGSIFITTLNKNIPHWIFGVVLAEYVIGVTPKNTHHWHKLISLKDVQRILSALNCKTILVKGFTYNVFRKRFQWINSTMMSYAIQAIKIQ
ncbi:ubiquinone biosynthesis O-methyltransferase-like [Rhagoletis pomonella]|uniref:ubiquinone biosynthesis O-methyltransferase-like n=1 Tax=Rhagoletis pomonella TaxID=28610 RepID=UPI00177B6442|nr:ubiquinone biosynthesis O-methyltransferase-like [Rhagoletis pomonella]